MKYVSCVRYFQNSWLKCTFYRESMIKIDSLGIYIIDSETEHDSEILFSHGYSTTSSNSRPLRKWCNAWMIPRKKKIQKWSSREVLVGYICLSKARKVPTKHWTEQQQKCISNQRTKNDEFCFLGEKSTDFVYHFLFSTSLHSKGRIIYSSAAILCCCSQR